MHGLDHLPSLVLKTFSAVLLASLITISAAPAHADAEYDANARQPETSVTVLPQGCTGPVNVMPTRARACRVTTYKSRPTVFVWGDSHSWQQTPALIARAQSTRTNLVTFQMGACPPMDLSRTGYRGQCARLGELALARIERASRHERVTVVLGGAWALYADLVARVEAGWVPEGNDAFLARQAAMWKVGTPRAFKALDAMRRVRTIGMAQMPMRPSTAPTEGEAPAEPGTPEHSSPVPRAEAIPREAAVAAWLSRSVDRVVDATRYVCDATWCYPTVSEMPTWLDALHLNPAVSTTFAAAYAPAFRR